MLEIFEHMSCARLSGALCCQKQLFAFPLAGQKGQKSGRTRLTGLCTLLDGRNYKKIFFFKHDWCFDDMQIENATYSD